MTTPIEFLADALAGALKARDDETRANERRRIVGQIHDYARTVEALARDASPGAPAQVSFEARRLVQAVANHVADGPR